MKTKFKLLKSIGNYKKGEVFDCFNGIVRGIYCDKTNKCYNFDDKKYFE